jgi:aminoglycoside 3-N-acetyltransferase
MSFSANDLCASFKKAGINPGDHILLHTSLFHLGKLDTVDDSESVPVQVAKAIISYLGPEGTLVVPAFSWSFYRGYPYDCRFTPAENDMGVLNEAVRKLPGSVRTRHPGQSFACVGKLAEALGDKELDTESAWDPKGPVGVLLSHGAKTVMLGPPVWGACSFIHYVEELQNVPYRYWKTYTGEYVPPEGGAETTKTYRFFARKLEPVEWMTNMPIAGDALHNAGALQAAPLGNGQVISFQWADAVAVLSKLIQENPAALAYELPALTPGAGEEGNVEDDNLPLPMEKLKECLSTLSNRHKKLLGLPISRGVQSGAESTVRNILNDMLGEEVCAELSSSSSLIEAGLDSSTFLLLLSKLEEAFSSDVSCHAASMQELTIFSGLLTACEKAHLLADENAEVMKEEWEQCQSKLHVMDIQDDKDAAAEATLIENNQAEIKIESLRIVLVGVGRPLLLALQSLHTPLGRKYVKVLRVYTSDTEQNICKLALQMGASVHSHERMTQKEADGCAQDMRRLKPDLLFSINNLKRIPGTVINEFHMGSFNLHPGRLPEYAGLHVAQWAIRNGDSLTEATLHWMNSDIDEGAVAYTKVVAIEKSDTGLTLLNRTMESGVTCFVRLIRDALLGRPILRTPQDMAKFHLYRSRDAKDGSISWKEWSAKQILDFVRAADYGPVASPTYTPFFTTHGQTITLKTSDISDLTLSVNGESGTVIGTGNDGILVSCCSGLLQIKSGTLVETGERLCGAQLLTRCDVSVGDKLQ